jgi:hypothetical protein
MKVRLERQSALKLANYMGLANQYLRRCASRIPVRFNLARMRASVGLAQSGALMAFAGLGWLTYLSNPLVNYLSPYNLASGLLGDVSVLLWLLVMGVNVQRCNELRVQSWEWKKLKSTTDGVRK